MPIAGLQFTKISAERKNPAKGTINVNHNAAIIDMKRQPSKIADQEAVKATFEFVTKIEPGVGTIHLAGEMVVLEKPSVVDRILKEWEKNRQFPQDMMEDVMNHLLTKCNIEALILGKEIGLPPTIQLPKVKVTSKKA